MHTIGKGWWLISNRCHPLGFCFPIYIRSPFAILNLFSEGAIPMNREEGIREMLDRWSAIKHAIWSIHFMIQNRGWRYGDIRNQSRLGEMAYVVPPPSLVQPQGLRLLRRRCHVLVWSQECFGRGGSFAEREREEREGEISETKMGRRHGRESL